MFRRVYNYLYRAPTPPLEKVDKETSTDESLLLSIKEPVPERIVQKESVQEESVQKESVQEEESVQKEESVQEILDQVVTPLQETDEKPCRVYNIFWP